MNINIEYVSLFIVFEFSTIDLYSLFHFSFNPPFEKRHLSKNTFTIHNSIGRFCRMLFFMLFIRRENNIFQMNFQITFLFELGIAHLYIENSMNTQLYN